MTYSCKICKADGLEFKVEDKDKNLMTEHFILEHGLDPLKPFKKPIHLGKKKSLIERIKAKFS